MPIWGVLQLLDVANINAKEKRVEGLLRKKGYKEESIKVIVSYIGYLWLDEKDKKRVYEKNTDITRETHEANMEKIFLVLFFQDLEIAEAVIGNKKEALKAHQEAISILPDTDKIRNLYKIKPEK